MFWLLGGTHHAMVVEQESGFVVVDAPLYDERADAIIDAIFAINPAKEIRHVVVSHHHEDHVAGIRHLLGRAPNAALVVSAKTVSFWRRVLTAPSTLRQEAFGNRRDLRVLAVPADDQLLIDDPSHPVTVFNMLNFHADDLLYTAVAGDANVGFVVDVYSPGLGAIPFLTPTFRDQLVERNFRTQDLKILGGHGFPVNGAIPTFQTLEDDIAALP